MNDKEGTKTIKLGGATCEKCGYINNYKDSQRFDRNPICPKCGGYLFPNCYKNTFNNLNEVINWGMEVFDGNMYNMLIIKNN